MPIFLLTSIFLFSKEHVAIMVVIQFPPRLSRNTDVIIELRYRMWCRFFYLHQYFSSLRNTWRSWWSYSFPPDCRVILKSSWSYGTECAADSSQPGLWWPKFNDMLIKHVATGYKQSGVHKYKENYNQNCTLLYLFLVFGWFKFSFAYLS